MTSALRQIGCLSILSKHWIHTRTGHTCHYSASRTQSKMLLNVAYGSFESITCVHLQGISASLYKQPKQMFVYAFCRHWLVFVFHHVFLRARCVPGGCCPGITFLHEGVAYDTSSGLGQTSPDPTFNTPPWSPQSPLVPFCALTTSPPLLRWTQSRPHPVLSSVSLRPSNSWAQLAADRHFWFVWLSLDAASGCQGTVAFCTDVTAVTGWLKTARIMDNVKHRRGCVLSRVVRITYCQTFTVVLLVKNPTCPAIHISWDP